MTINYSLNKKNIVILCMIVAVSVLGLYFAWKIWSNNHESFEETRQETKTVIVVPVVLKTLFREDLLPGEIEAYQDVLIYPKIPGFIKWIGVDRGSVVKKGQQMVIMYAPEYLARRNDALARIASAKAALAAEESKLQDIQADLKKSQANLLADQSTYQRVKAASLVPGVIADNDVVQWAQSVEVDHQEVNTFIKRVNAKEHEVSIRQEELKAEKKAFDDFATFSSYLEINAPFNGYVTERKMHVGSFVGPEGTGAYPPICRLKQLDLLRIVAPVPEQDAVSVVRGSEVQFSVSAFPEKIFVGRIARISDNLDRATRTMPVELNYFNPDYKILPGMFCQVHWPIHRRESSMFIPMTAVVTTQLDSFVCKIKDGAVKWTSVTKGQIMGNMVEVFGDLHEGDLVAQEGTEDLLNDSFVKAVPAKQ